MGLNGRSAVGNPLVGLAIRFIATDPRASLRSPWALFGDAFGVRVAAGAGVNGYGVGCEWTRLVHFVFGREKNLRPGTLSQGGVAKWVAMASVDASDAVVNNMCTSSLI